MFYAPLGRHRPDAHEVVRDREVEVTEVDAEPPIVALSAAAHLKALGHAEAGLPACVIHDLADVFDEVPAVVGPGVWWDGGGMAGMAGVADDRRGRRVASG